MEHLIAGAGRFFSRTDLETLLTWRLLMISHYRLESARDAVTRHLLDAPVRFFTALFMRLQEAERISTEADAPQIARVVASIFFEHSFRANLVAAWEDGSPDFLEEARGQLEVVARALDTPRRPG